MSSYQEIAARGPERPRGEHVLHPQPGYPFLLRISLAPD